MCMYSIHVKIQEQIVCHIVGTPYILPVHVCMYACIYACVYACIYVCMHVYMYHVCMYVLYCRWLSIILL